MAETLGRLITDLGERSDYDAAAQCSRCGYCEQSCPTYVNTAREAQSPRGRAQIFRLMLEGKLDDAKAAEEAFTSCLLCGGCTTTCYAKVPVADLALEARRRLRGKTHWLVRLLSWLMIEHRSFFARLLKWAFACKRVGLSRLLRPLLRRVGLAILATMDEHVSDAPRQFFDDELGNLPASLEKSNWNYFAACGPRYLFPHVASASWKALTTLQGTGRFLDNGCCGLLANNYGDVEDAREAARRNIVRAEKMPDGAIISDCSSCAAFLKTYPQLFLSPEQESWRRRAEVFSSRVQDVVERYDSASFEDVASAPLGGVVTYHDSCRAVHGQGLKAQPHAAVKAAAGEKFCEMEKSDLCCGGAGAFAFTNEELSDEILMSKLGHIAHIQSQTVVTSSTSCLIQLARGLRKYYPDAHVLHISEFILRALKDRHGT